MRSQSLNGLWSFRSMSESQWYRGEVPGSVVCGLMEAGRIGDPYWRDNENQATELSWQNYEYSRTFAVDDGLWHCDRLLLVCEGLDTLAEITLNGTLIASTDNMHRRYEWDVKPYLEPEGNTLSIIFRSPLRYIEERQRERALWSVNPDIHGFPHLRKAHYMFGWDWGPRIPDAGIWKDIYLQGCSTIRIKDVYVSQKHTEDSVKLSVSVTVDGIASESEVLAIEAVLTDPDGGEETIVLDAAVKHNTLSMEVKEPKLWWPNGFGKQPLYGLKVRVISDSAPAGHDEQSFRIGLRNFTIRREPDEWGESFDYEINGIRIFAMGANYIPQDNILSRLNRDRTERLIQDCVKANFNTIRVWGGAFFPHDWFYNLCDEYGLIVWQDFMFGCAVYEMTPEFRETVRREAEDNIRRLRHHASLGLWCGNNEMEWAWVEWEGVDQRPELREDYLSLFEGLLPEVLQELDPDRFYWPASPSSGGGFDKPNDPDYGDVHYWEVWNGGKSFEDYQKYYFRFCSEFGYQSFPEWKTVESFTLPEDRNMFSYVMEVHQRAGSGNSRILTQLADNYLYPKDFDSILYITQLLQAHAIQIGVEHWRRHRGRCMGAIYWQLNDSWPVASWSSIDYYGRWKALHYAAKRFYAPVLLSARVNGAEATLHLINETMGETRGRVLWKLSTFNGEVLLEGGHEVCQPPLSTEQVAAPDLASYLSEPEQRRSVYLHYAYEADGQTVSGGTVLFAKPKHCAFQDPGIKAEVKEGSESFEIRLRADAYAKSVQLMLLREDATFSDNYFDMSAWEEKRILIQRSDLSVALSLVEVVEQLRIRSLYDTY